MNKNGENLVKCSICGDKHYPGNMNGVFRNAGCNYYCHKKECQEIFTEDAGNPPDDEEHDFYN